VSSRVYWSLYLTSAGQAFVLWKKKEKTFPISRTDECCLEKDCLRWHWLSFRQPKRKSSLESRVALRLSKGQAMSSQTGLLRTTLVRTIILYRLMTWLQVCCTVYTTYTMNMSFNMKILVAKQGDHPQKPWKKIVILLKACIWHKLGVKILHGGALITFRENEHDRVGLVRVCHFVEDPLNVAKNWTRNRGREGGNRGREPLRKDSVQERAYTGERDL